jgi:hypothetical protein
VQAEVKKYEAEAARETRQTDGARKRRNVRLYIL